MENSPDRLGDLELAIMNVLWRADGPLEVKAVAAQLGRQRAYTTVMTTLSRLHKKGYLTQQKHGRAFAYSPRVSQKTILKKTLSRVAATLFNGDVQELVPHLLGIDRPLSDAERKKLQALALSIKDRDHD